MTGLLRGKERGTGFSGADSQEHPKKINFGNQKSAPAFCSAFAFSTLLTCKTSHACLKLFQRVLSYFFVFIVRNLLLSPFRFVVTVYLRCFSAWHLRLSVLLLLLLDALSLRPRLLWCVPRVDLGRWALPRSVNRRSRKERTTMTETNKPRRITERR